jgi:peptide/nickel transport system ATP-binding protein
VALLASIPSPDPAQPGEPLEHTILGEPPSPIDPPSGCRFRTRCPRAQDICATEEPPLRELAQGHHGACHFPVIAQASAPTAAAASQPDLGT